MPDDPRNMTPRGGTDLPPSRNRNTIPPREGTGWLPPPRTFGDNPTRGPGPHLPDWVPRAQDNPGRGDINETAMEPSRRYATVSAEGTMLPIIYGVDYIGPIISLAVVRGSYLYLRCLWCLGEIDAVENVKFQDDSTPSPGSVLMTHYTGRADQPVDPTLALAIPGYNDRCVVEINGESVGVAYSVVRILANSTQGFPRLLAKIRGRLVRDPRGGPFIPQASNDFNTFATPRIKIGYDGTAHKYTASPNTRGTNAGALTSNSAVGTVTCMLRNTGTLGVAKRVFDAGSGKFTVSVETDNKIRVVGRNAANTVVLDVKSVNTVGSSTTTGTAIVCSFDLSPGVGKVHLFLNGAQDEAIGKVATAGQLINFAATGYAIGGEAASTSNPLDGHLSALTFQPAYFNLTVAETRAQFFDIQGRVIRPPYTPLFDAKIGYKSGMTYANTPAVLAEQLLNPYTVLTAMDRESYVYQGLNAGIFYYRSATGADLFVNSGLTTLTGQIPVRMYAHVDYVTGPGSIKFQLDGALDLFELNSTTTESVVEFTPIFGGGDVNFISTGEVSALIRQVYVFPSPHHYETTFSDLTNDLVTAGTGWGSDNGFFSQIDPLTGGAYTPVPDNLRYTPGLWYTGERVEWMFEAKFLTPGVPLNLKFGTQLVKSVDQDGLYTGSFIAGVAQNAPMFEVTGEGAIIRCSFTTNTTYRKFSKTPSLMLADLIESRLYGLGGDVNDQSLMASCSYNEEVVVGTTETELRHQAGITMAQQQNIVQWLETFRAYARCFVTQRNGEYVLVPDKPSPVVASIGPSNMVRGSLKLSKKSLLQLPNVIKVYYTSTVAEPWTEEFVEVVSAKVTTGEEFRRETSLRLPGIQSKSMATRYAIERLNSSTLIDLQGSLAAYDAAWPIDIGDVIEISHPVGLTSKQVRVTACDVADRGKMNITFTEYDPNAYSSVVVDEPPPPDTTSDTPFKVPAVTGLVLSESFYNSGLVTSSQLGASWTALTYAFLQHYLVEVYENGVKVLTSRTPDAFYFFRDLQIGAVYNVQVRAVSTAFVSGLPTSASMTAMGSNLPPDFSNGQISAFEAGDAINAYVRQPAVDIDLWGYEWRYREAVAGNLWPKGGVNFSGADWSGGMAGGCTFSTRSLRYTWTSGTQSMQATSAGSSLVNGGTYDVYIKVKKFSPVGNCGVSFAVFGASPIAGGGTLWLQKSTANNRAGLYVIRNVVVDTTQNFFIAKYDAGGSLAEFEVEYIAFRQPASNCEADWATAQFFDRSPSTNIRINQVAGGAYVIYCKALDSVRSTANPYGQYSSVTKLAYVNVISDANAFLRLEFVPGWQNQTQTLYAQATQATLDEYNFTTADGGNELRGFMVPVQSGRTWNAAFSGTVNSYGSPVFNNFETGAGGTHVFSHDVVDIGTVVNGRLNYSYTLNNFSAGASTFKLYYWNNPGDTPSSKTLPSIDVPIEYSGRYFYLEVTATAGKKTAISRNSRQTVEVTAYPRQETGTAITQGPDGSGNAQPVTVTLQNSYVSALSVRAWATTTTPLDVYVDNISVGPVTTFTIVSLNLRGEPTAANVNWEFKGV